MFYICFALVKKNKINRKNKVFNFVSLQSKKRWSMKRGMKRLPDMTSYEREMDDVII